MHMLFFIFERQLIDRKRATKKCDAFIGLLSKDNSYNRKGANNAHFVCYI